MSLQITLLPNSVALLSNFNNRYLHYTSEKDAARFRFVQFSGKEILSPNVKFEIEKATTGSGGLVHIRASYSNKYLRRETSKSSYIVAGADKTEEDRSKWDCTLFEPLQVQSADVNNNVVIRLRHVQLGLYVVLINPELLAMANDVYPISSNGLFTVINWETLVELPKYIAIKCDIGRYLGSRDVEIQHEQLLVFTSTDIEGEDQKFEVFPNSDGNVMIQQCVSGYWFKVDPENVVMVSQDSGTVFKPVYVGDDNVIALKSLYSNKFCCRYPTQRYSHALFANSTNITKRAKLVVEEYILRRTVTIKYRLDDARIYGLAPIILVTSTEENHQPEPSTKHVKLDYETTTITTWQASASIKGGFKCTISVDAIPIIGKGTLELSVEGSGSKQWGGTDTTKKTVSDGGDYTIKPMHKLTVRKLATQGYCNVPYSYVQTDYLVNGDVIGPIQKEDGIFTGVNSFDIYTDSYQEPINT